MEYELCQCQSAQRPIRWPTWSRLLAQGSSGTSGAANANPLSTLLDELSGSDATTGSPPPAVASTGTTGGSSSTSFDPGTMAALLALQDQSATGTQGPSQLFGSLDTDGSGQISQSEFETALGNDGVDQSSADALFSKLDANPPNSTPTVTGRSASRNSRPRSAMTASINPVPMRCSPSSTPMVTARSAKASWQMRSTLPVITTIITCTPAAVVKPTLRLGKARSMRCCRRPAPVARKPSPPPIRTVRRPPRFPMPTAARSR